MKYIDCSAKSLGSGRFRQIRSYALPLRYGTLFRSHPESLTKPAVPHSDSYCIFVDVTFMGAPSALLQQLLQEQLEESLLSHRLNLGRVVDWMPLTLYGCLCLCCASFKRG